MDRLFTDALQALLTDLCSGPQLRALESGDHLDRTWQALVESGFLDALLPEEAGGAGLSLTEVVPLLVAAGYHALPLPFADTLVLRGLLGSAPGKDATALALATPGDSAGTARLFQELLPGVTAVVIAGPESSTLYPVTSRAADTPGLLHVSAATADSLPAIEPLLAGAFIESTQMAGCMQRLLEMTVAYANERQQFGRSIGRFQAIQQQISVMTGHCHAAVMAAQLAAGGARYNAGRLQLDAAHVAAARTIICEVAQPVSEIAHAVHGAIGITAEYDLQLWTRRLQRGRRCFGADGYWAARLGEHCLATEGALYPLVQAQLAP